MPPRSDADDEHLTLRAPRSSVALIVALAAHVLFGFLVTLLPEPEKPDERIQVSLVERPSSPSASSAAPRAPEPRSEPQKRPRPRPETARAEPKPTPSTPSTTPIVPVLPPSEDPPENRARLPVAEASPEPPTSSPSAWKERLYAQLGATRPRPPAVPTGPLAASFGNLNQVADLDPRLHDDDTERRIAEDFGPFMRRGLEALRRQWRPQEVLNRTERDPSKRCGRQNRTTFAVAVINQSGDVVDVELKNPSGCPDLDVEAMAAFQRVGQFPNPPKGLFVDREGNPTKTTRYPVRFIVTFDGGLKLDWDWR